MYIHNENQQSMTIATYLLCLLCFLGIKFMKINYYKYVQTLCTNSSGPVRYYLVPSRRVQTIISGQRLLVFFKDYTMKVIFKQI